MNYGPSPRGWGTQSPQHTRTSRNRTIPTRVGNSIESGEALPLAAVHPHAGGELSDKIASPVMIPGPSPRGWGTQLACCADVMVIRSIPTRVGNSRAYLSPHPDFPVHPHAGGELSR